MAVRAIVCLTAMLLVCLEVKVTGKHECNPMNPLVECGINPRLRLHKSKNYYCLTILVCSNHQCNYTDVPEILNNTQWMECKKVCKHCKSLRGQGYYNNCRVP